MSVTPLSAPGIFNVLDPKARLREDTRVDRQRKGG
jgi:hypothetical protein